ncbi:hypothetical protein Q7C36_005505 [Tachysurus vachellii]|uniref:MARVEL domain-containing protein n=1 Tax=Tachysurus vachellii TaxID=175792 RepID=A0AA88NF29_TACVA|nr:myeloid-associated differentiation marker homolog [Tachysurus vachellii]KAK2857586.1 hypothetical protein Q7C36_005505 [Tachysurus vachellii]
MPVTFGELSTLTTPLSMVRLSALLFSCLTFSLASYFPQGNESSSVIHTTFNSFCKVTWCLFFVLTFLVMVIHFIQFHNLLPLSWKNLTATIAALGALMTFFASFAFTWTLVNHQPGPSNPKSIAAAVGSYLTSLAYSEELHLIRSQSNGQQRGYMATVPGLLKVLQVFGGCVALMLLLIVQPENHWRIYVSAVTYSMCLLPTVGTVLVMVMDCAARSPVPFDRLLASFSLLGVIMYTVNTVICFTQALERSQPNQHVVIVSETVIACITLLAYTVDLAFSVKLLCDRN